MVLTSIALIAVQRWKVRNERGGSMKAMMLLGLILIATPLVVLTLGIGWLMDDSFDSESDTK